MKKPLLLLVLLLSAKIAYSQLDTLFWFAAPEVTKATANYDRPIVLRITSYAQAATVTISQPASSTFPTQVLNIPANSLLTFDLTPWIDQIENKPENTVLPYGLKIQSNSQISLYYEVVSSTCNCNPEIFVLKGQAAFGNDFWIPAQTLLNNNPAFLPVTNSSIDLVATQDNTTITIIPSRDLVGHPAGIAFIINLDEGETYSAKAASGLAAQHLNGSRVFSDQPIAITIKDDVMNSSVYGTCSDLGGDQIVPVTALGTEFIAINGFLNNIGDQIFILGTQNGTGISQNGNPITTIGAGETLQLDVGDSSTYIRATHPISILQISGYGCEVGIDVLPQINCTGSNNIRLARSTSEPFFINLLVKNGSQNNFLVNGASGIIDGATFKQVPGTNGNWLSGQVLLNTSIFPVGSSALVSNSSTPFHMSAIHGGPGTGTRFGYFSSFLSSATSTQSVNICPGETYEGYAASGTYIDTLQSQLGCDSIRTIHLTVSPNVSGSLSVEICPGEMHEGYAVSGTYVDTLQSAAGCDSIRTLTLTVLPNALSTQSVNICLGEIYEGYSVSGTYADTLQSAIGCDSIRTLHLVVQPTQASNERIIICPGTSYDFNGQILSNEGVYTDTFSTVAGCDSIVRLELTIADSEFLGKDSTICTGNDYLLRSPSADTYWFDNTRGSTKIVEENGTYWATIIDPNGCEIMDTVFIQFNTKIYVPNTFSPNDDGINDYFQPYFSEANFINYRFSVFDRWGNWLFTTIDPSQFWNGKHKASDCNIGVYTYFIEFETATCKKTILKGAVNLLR